MGEAFEKANPGLARRFPLEQAFRFRPYDDGELAQILELKLGKHSLSASVEGMKVAKGILTIARHRPNFGNGGDIENMLQLAMSRRNGRCAASSLDEDLDLELLPQGFDPDFTRTLEADKRCVKLFEELEAHGEHHARSFGNTNQWRLAFRNRDHDPRRYIPWALVFRGPPGTWKDRSGSQGR